MPLPQATQEGGKQHRQQERNRHGQEDHLSEMQRIEDGQQEEAGERPGVHREMFFHPLLHLSGILGRDWVMDGTGLIHRRLARLDGELSSGTESKADTFGVRILDGA